MGYSIQYTTVCRIYLFGYTVESPKKDPLRLNGPRGAHNRCDLSAKDILQMPPHFHFSFSTDSRLAPPNMSFVQRLPCTNSIIYTVECTCTCISLSVHVYHSLSVHVHVYHSLSVHVHVYHSLSIVYCG